MRRYELGTEILAGRGRGMRSMLLNTVGSTKAAANSNANYPGLSLYNS